MDDRIRRRHLDQLAAELRRRLIERRRADAAAGEPNRAPLPEAVHELVETDAAMLEPATRARLGELILREAVGLGPLEELLGDPAVEEVMVNGPDRVYVERAGRIEWVDVSFDSEQALRDAIERILTPLGRRVDELSPMADARLGDGSRVHVVIPPLSVDGPAMSIRRFTAVRPDTRELVGLGTIVVIAVLLLRFGVKAVQIRSPQPSPVDTTRRWALFVAGRQRVFPQDVGLGNLAQPEWRNPKAGLTYVTDSVNRSGSFPSGRAR